MNKVNMKEFVHDVRVPLLVLLVLCILLALAFTDTAQGWSKWADSILFDYTCEPVPFDAPADYKMVCYKHDGTPA